MDGGDQRLATDDTAGKVQYDEATEALMTDWMRNTLLVSWAVHPAPLEVERAVIALLRPPLNWDHNRDHPNWQALDAARRSWRASSKPSPSPESPPW